MKAMKICIAGIGNIAVDAADYVLNELGCDKEHLLILPTGSDCGQNTWQRSLKKWALINGIKIVELENIYNEKEMTFISLHFDRIINPNKFLTDKLFNIHFSNLPTYKGCFTSIHPIIRGENKSGVTLHCIDAGIDTGDIIAQDIFDIDINDTARNLYQKYLDNGFNLFKNTIDDLIENRYRKYRQSNLNSSYYSRGSIDFSKVAIDLKKTSFEIHNQVRAFIFPEYQLPKINGKAISKSLLTDEKIQSNFIDEDKDGYIISGIDGYKIILGKAI